jgi:hypothetical protein
MLHFLQVTVGNLLHTSLTGMHCFEQVEDELFKIPRHYFEKNSTVWADVFSLPPVVNQVAEGASDEHPIILESIEKADFQVFLSVLLPE